MYHHICQLLSLLPQQSLVLGHVLHQPVIPAVKNTELAARDRHYGAQQPPGSRLLLLLQLHGSEVISVGAEHDHLQHLAGSSREQLSALVKLQHLEERTSEQDLPLVLDVGQLADVHSADRGHNVAGKPSPVEGEVFFVQPDDMDLHQHEPSGLVRLQGEETLSLGSVHAGRDKSQRDGDVACVDGSIRQSSELEEVVLGTTDATLHLPLEVLERRVLEVVVVEVDVQQLYQEHRCSDDVVALGAVVLS